MEPTTWKADTRSEDDKQSRGSLHRLVGRRELEARAARTQRRGLAGVGGVFFFGRPPFAPFVRAASALASEVLQPPRRPSDWAALFIGAKSEVAKSLVIHLHSDVDFSAATEEIPNLYKEDVLACAFGIRAHQIVIRLVRLDPYPANVRVMFGDVFFRAGDCEVSAVGFSEFCSLFDGAARLRCLTRNLFRGFGVIFVRIGDHPFRHGVQSIRIRQVIMTRRAEFFGSLRDRAGGYFSECLLFCHALDIPKRLGFVNGKSQLFFRGGRGAEPVRKSVGRRAPLRRSTMRSATAIKRHEQT